MATLNYYVDWNNNNAYDHANSDVTALVMTSSWRFGRNAAHEFDAAGSLSLLLDNSTSLFSSFNSASPIYGKIVPNLRVKITMTSGGATTTMAVCKLDSITPSVGNAPGAVLNTANLVANGVLNDFGDGDCHVALQENQDAGALMTAFLNADGFSATERTIDVGLTTIAKWWARKGSSRIQTIRGLQAAEFGRVREGKNGYLCLENRDHPFTAPHNAAQATYGTGTLNIWNLRQENPLLGIFNKVSANVHAFNKSEDVILAVLADVPNNQGGTPLIVPAGTGSPVVPGTLTVNIDYPMESSPANYISVDSWSSIDLEANTAGDRTGTDITASVAVTLTKLGQRLQLDFSNSYTSEAHLVVLRAHGVAIVEGDPIPISSEDATSQTAYRKREYPYPPEWFTNQTDGQAHLDHIITVFKNPRPRLIFDVKGDYDTAHLNEVRTRDIGDRIRVVASLADFGLAIDAEFIIDSLSYNVTSDAMIVMTVACTQAPTAQLAASNTPYTPKTITALPDDLEIASIDPSLHCTFQARPWKFKEHVVSARFHAKYFATEQAAPVDLSAITHDGVNNWVVDGISTSGDGTAEYELDAPDDGFIYYAFQFVSTAGDSVWSDGTRTACLVEDFLPTNATSSAGGPPADWWVELDADVVNHRVRIRASRPKTNGEKIWAWYGQIKDNRSGSWGPVNNDEVTGTFGHVMYGYSIAGMGAQYPEPADSDPSWVDHALSNDNRRLTRSSGTGLHGNPSHVDDYVEVGDLILLDPRPGTWDAEHCQWSIVDSIQGLKTGYNSETATYFDVLTRFRDRGYTNFGTGMRLVAVHPPWTWTGGGYLGAQQNKGWFQESFWKGDKHGDVNTEVFVGPWMDVPSSVPLANVEGRVWFDNGYSVHDGGVIYGGIVEDTGNPSGASNLVVLTHDEDPTIPEGQIALQFSRDTVNYKGIWAIAAWFSRTLAAEGPFAAERAAHSDCVIEEGTCIVSKGNKVITVTRPSPPSSDAEVLNRILMIYTDDASPDSDIDGTYVTAITPTTFKGSGPFLNRSGNFAYSVIKRFMDYNQSGSPATADTTNLLYVQFTPAQCAGDIEQAVWRTPTFAAPNGAFYATLCSRNRFGLGTRLTSAQASSGGGCVELTPTADGSPPTYSVDTNLDLGKKFRFATGGNPVLINNPTGTVKCGYPFLYVITGTGAITVDTKFNLRGQTLTRSAGRDYLGCIYNAEDDEYDCWWSADGT